MKLGFGKYKGHTIENVRLCDPQYIVWLHDKADRLDPEVRAAVTACYDDCVEAANRKIATGQPERRKVIPPKDDMQRSGYELF